MPMVSIILPYVLVIITKYIVSPRVPGIVGVYLHANSLTWTSVYIAPFYDF